MTKKTTSMVILLGCLSAVGVGFILSQDGFQSQSTQETVEEFVRESSGTIDVSGSIVDQDGISLDDVSVEVFEVNPADMFGKLRNGRIERFDREFRIRRTGVSSIDCGFFKEGYYDERRSYSVPETAQESGEKVHTKKDELIVLVRIPKPAPLQKVEGSLQSDALRPGSVLFAVQPRDSDTRLYSGRFDEDSGSTLEGPHVLIEPGIDESGQLSRTLFDMEGIGGVQKILRSGRIVMSRPETGDGFLVVDVVDVSALEKRQFRKMNETPPDGYNPSVDLRVESGEKDLFFYCRIAGNYGKGMVTNLVPIIEKEGEENAYARILIFLNPTGSTDVSYLHY